MARYQVRTTARHPNGTPAPLHTLTFYTDSGAGTLATLYVSEVGAPEVDNPYTTDASAIVDFWTEDTSLWVLASGDTSVRPVNINLAAGSLPINVMDYGALGAGADYTAEIQAAVTAGAGGTIVFPAGTYVVSDTIDVLSGTTLRGEGGTIKLSNSPAGTLDTQGRVFSLDGVSNVRIEGLTCEYPASAASYSLTWAGESGPGTIWVHDSTHCRIADCSFDMTGLGNTTLGMNAVWVVGTSSDTDIVGNDLTFCGIVYGYNGTSRTLVQGNRITASVSNAIGGMAAVGTPNYDNRIIDNIIVDAGRMGIEDWGDSGLGVFRTQICGNSIIGCGKTAAAGALMGISCVAQEGIISGNTIVDAPEFGIEAWAERQIVTGNVVKNGTMAPAGIGISCAGHLTTPGGITIGDNHVERFGKGIFLFTDFAHALVQGNSVIGYAVAAISMESTADESRMSCIGNHIRCTTPNNDAGNADRKGIYCYADAVGKAEGSVIIGNFITYDASADGGTSTGLEYSIKPSCDGLLIMGNTIDANGVLTNSAPPTLNSYGGGYSDVRIIANTFLGGAVWRAQYLADPVALLNNTASDYEDGKLGFFDKQATPVAKPEITGSRAGNAALADLLTSLAALGLITDSSS